MHDVEAKAKVEYVPDSQLVHVLSEGAPFVELAFPASHAWHIVEEVVELCMYLVVLDDLILSSSLIALILSSTFITPIFDAHLNFPTSQSVQGLVPTVSLNFPGGQASISTIRENSHLIPTS